MAEIGTSGTATSRESIVALLVLVGAGTLATGAPAPPIPSPGATTLPSTGTTTPRSQGSGDARARVVLDVPVAPDGPRTTRIEPHLAVHPEDPDHLVAAAGELGEPITIATFVSRDGGRTWSRNPVPVCWLDPWVAFAPDGRVVLACIDHEDRPGILLHTSLDGGDSWKEPVTVPLERGPTIEEVGGYDHESIVFGTRNGAPALFVVAMQAVRTGGLLRAGPVLFAAAGGSGRVAAGPKALSAPRRFLHGNVWANAVNPVRLADDSVGFAYMDFAAAEGEEVEPLRTRRAWWVRSDDGGRTFGVPRLIAELDGTSTLPVIAAGAIDAGDGAAGAGIEGVGRVYLAVDERHEGRSGVRLHRSTDAGDSWQAGPWLTAESEHGPFGNPVVAVDGRGAVGVAWYDGSDSEHGCLALRFAVSVDGGGRFGAPLVVRGGSCDETEARTGRRARWPWGGDYFGLAGLPYGGFQILWSHADDGRYDLSTVRVEVESPGSSGGAARR